MPQTEAFFYPDNLVQLFLSREDSIDHNSVPRFSGAGRDALFVQPGRDPVEAHPFGPQRL
jgi:hypothetical protein